MPICIECRYPVQRLYDEYSKADDRSLGKGVRLTQCPRCKRFADKYVEHDFVVLFIDLVLIKPQVSPSINPYVSSNFGGEKGGGVQENGLLVRTERKGKGRGGRGDGILYCWGGPLWLTDS